ncbi:hypothetical protein PHLGIDRAFT_467104 [Phlebiopsis gigantea 11061_1 CR5-6]|uniref:Protein-S-isoprenylcysteine O-methyltransferase n=1 Tax=Phlebiopsis gigantea (strain 11061_1 CR5-6) TaxID=745531 RepID=A0A0C3PJ95_PHLG1|nr:hypothetical protein PHLGIDRAFT_467104 [Phlebiopsis gigantea 11061_1 CR5-6]
MLYLPGTARTSFFLAAATANQLALSIPFPQLAAIEATVPVAKGLHNALYRPRWFWVIPAWKTVVWCSTALELTVAYGLLDPSSYKLLACPSLGGADALPISAVVGLSILAASAVTQVISRLTLGRYSHFPVLPLSLTFQRPLHVPPSIVDSMALSRRRIMEPRTDDTGDAGETTYSLRPSHELVADGPYGYVRHPMYSNFLFGGVGSIMFYNSSITPLVTSIDAMKSLFSHHFPYVIAYISPILSKVAWRKSGLALAVVALGVTYIRLYRVARIEEEALQQRFGSRWKLYKWHVWSILV